MHGIVQVITISSANMYSILVKPFELSFLLKKSLLSFEVYILPYWRTLVVGACGAPESPPGESDAWERKGSPAGTIA